MVDDWMRESAFGMVVSDGALYVFIWINLLFEFPR